MAEGIHDTPDFSEFIAELNGGVANAQLTAKLAKVVAAVEEIGKSGSLTVTFNVKKEGAMAIVGVEAKAKVPEHPINGSLYFFGANGVLCRDDPRQLKLKNLDAPKRNLKTVSFPTGDPKPVDGDSDSETADHDDAE